MFCNAENQFNLFHDWSKWDDDRELHKISRRSVGDQDWRQTGWLVVQTRVCRRCNLKQQKMIRTEI